jgi:hypothetical protein
MGWYVTRPVSNLFRPPGSQSVNRILDRGVLKPQDRQTDRTVVQSTIEQGADGLAGAPPSVAVCPGARAHY